MSKRLKARFKKSRRLGAALWGSAKDPFHKRNYRPGQHGAAPVKLSDYGKHLKAKQQLKFYYGDISERRFFKIYKEAARIKGDTSENLIGLLERRLASVVYRMNVVPTVFAARQFVNHKHILVNGEKCNCPNRLLKIGDVVEVRDKAKKMTIVLDTQKNSDRPIPDYIEFDDKTLTAKITRVPVLADVPYPVQMEPKLVVEFYSK